jgi:hypothetical protein
VAATNSSGATAPVSSVPGAPSLATIPPPQNASDWAYAILLALGINPNANNGAPLTALIAQMHVEDPTLGYLSSPSVNNPLAVTNPGGTPIPGNPDGVQSYSNWLTGLDATVTDIKANPAMLAALQSGASCQQYGGAVAKSNWEGGGSGNVNNPGYGAAVASACTIPAVQNAESDSAFDQAIANSNLGPDIISALGNPALDVGGAVAAATESVPSFLALLTSSRTWIFVGGAVVALVGLVGFLSTTKEGQKVVSQGEGAAKIAALA